MLRSIILVAALLLAFSHQQSDSRWLYIDGYEGGTTYYADKNVRHLRSGNITTWIKKLEQNGSYQLEHDECDCDGGRFKITALVNYDKNGNRTSFHNYESGEWISPPPDTIGEEMLEFVCKHAKGD